ncbi:MAG: hypothetical protein ACC630_03185 [Nitrospinota bacterium]
MQSNRFMIFMIIVMVISFMSMDAGHSGLFGESSHYGMIETYEGFFAGFKEDRVSIVDSKTDTLSSFNVSPSVKVTYRDNTIEKKDIVIHSMVRLIVINNIVEEIIIWEEARQ